jgi:hypothetical protein
MVGCGDVPRASVGGARILRRDSANRRIGEYTLRVELAISDQRGYAPPVLTAERVPGVGQLAPKSRLVRTGPSL